VKYFLSPICLTALVVLPLIAVPVHAETALQSQLRAAYSNQCKLAMSGDYAGLTNTFSPEFVNATPDGSTQTRDQMITMTKQTMQSTKITGCDVSFASTKRNADGSVTAIVTQTQNGVLNSAPLVSTATRTDTWVKQNGKWVVSGSVTSEASISVNGTVVDRLGGTTAAPTPTTSP
jgi:hypothetical protein